MINAKMAGIVFAAFVVGSFVASPELRAYAANTVFSTDIVDGQVKTADIAGNAVTAAKIKDGEVKAAEIATDAVGGSELQGLTKLLFGECIATINSPISPGTSAATSCSINGVDSDDRAIATLNTASGGASANCVEVYLAAPTTNAVAIRLTNHCDSDVTPATMRIGILVYDK